MKLYKITIRHADSHSEFFVVAKNRQEACDLVMSSWRDWKYWNGAYIEHTTLIAQEGQYGKPDILLISKPDATTGYVKATIEDLGG